MNLSDLKLETSIPANNWKIIELYNKLKVGQILINPVYQRKLVWKKQHKFDFIDTILRNYPFPEIYLATGSLDQEKLILIDEIVDGQQRLTTIQNYINEVDVFSFPKIPIKRFSELSQIEKGSFLNYEVSIRYLKNVTEDQIKDIFQRINKTDYALNAAERLNAQWGESEFICFCKQIVEIDFDNDGTQYIIDTENRKSFLDFFHGEDENDSVFSNVDKSRMLAMQYIMTLIATVDIGEYFNRNDKVDYYIKTFNDAFPQANELEEQLASIINFIISLKLERKYRWLSKANLFTLIVELSKIDLSKINSIRFAHFLTDLDYRAALNDLGLTDETTKLTPTEQRYLDNAREAVNQKQTREFRGEFIQNLLDRSKN